MSNVAVSHSENGKASAESNGSTKVSMCRGRIDGAESVAPTHVEWRREGRWWRPALLLLLLTVAAVFLVGRWLQYRWSHVVSREAAIEGFVSNVGARIDGRIAEIHVQCNQQVHRGDVLITLENAHLVAELARREAVVRRAEQAVRSEEEAVKRDRVRLLAELDAARARTDVAEQEVKVRESNAQRWVNEQKRFDSIRDPYLAIAARSNAIKLRQQRERLGPLVSQGVITEEEWEEVSADLTSARALWAESLSRNLSEKFQIKSALASAEAAIDQARAGLGAARLECREIQARIDQLQAREALIVLLQCEVEVAKADRQVAQANLDATIIRAPADGWVAENIVGPGGSVKVGDPIVSLWLAGPVWIEAHVDESQLDRVRVGSLVDVHVAAYPEEIIAGRVEAIGVLTSQRLSGHLEPHEWRWNGGHATTAIRIAVTEKDPRLTPGLSAVIGIHTEEATERGGESWLRRLASLR